MQRKLSLVFGSLLVVGSLAASVTVPVSAPLLFDVVSGLGAAAGLLFIFSRDYTPVVAEARPAVHVKRQRAQRLAARKIYASRTVHALVETAH